MHEHLSTLDVRERRRLHQVARFGDELQRCPNVAEPCLCSCETREDAHVKISQACGTDAGAQLDELILRFVVAAGLEQRFRPGDGAFEAAAVVGRDAVGEKTRIDPEPNGEPIDRLSRGARLAALDLADVFLREALAGEIALCQPGGNAELAQALAKANARRAGLLGARAGFEIVRHGGW